MAGDFRIERNLLGLESNVLPVTPIPRNKNGAWRIFRAFNLPFFKQTLLPFKLSKQIKWWDSKDSNPSSTPDLFFDYWFTASRPETIPKKNKTKKWRKLRDSNPCWRLDVNPPRQGGIIDHYMKLPQNNIYTTAKSWLFLVGIVRIELTTFCSQNRRATSALYSDKKMAGANGFEPIYIQRDRLANTPSILYSLITKPLQKN